MWLVQSPPTIAKLSEVNIVYGEKLDYFGINDSERAQRRSQGNCLLSLSLATILRIIIQCVCYSLRRYTSDRINDVSNGYFHHASGFSLRSVTHFTPPPPSSIGLMDEDAMGN